MVPDRCCLPGNSTPPLLSHSRAIWVFPEMPEGTLFILDVHNAIEHIAE